LPIMRAGAETSLSFTACVRRHAAPAMADLKPFDGVERRRGPAASVNEIAADWPVVRADDERRERWPAASDPLEPVIPVIQEKIGNVLSETPWRLYLVDAKQERLRLATGSGEREEEKAAELAMGGGIAGSVAASGQAAVVANARRDARIARGEERLGKETRSVVAVPVRFQKDVLGVLEVMNFAGPEGISPRDKRLVEVLADYAALAIEDARHAERIRELTIIDDVTGLYNVRHLNTVLDEEIYRSIRYAFEFSVIFLDLDRFKSVNDNHGHLLGSRLLVEVGEILRHNLRLIDFAFRYGGDEFVVVLPQTSKENACHATRRLNQVVHEHEWLAAAKPLRLTASFGIATFPGDARTKAGLLRLADEAMYTAKRERRGSIAVTGIGILPGPSED
jgi:diguanylate cyclase (GGDEF)-like protein